MGSAPAFCDYLTSPWFEGCWEKADIMDSNIWRLGSQSSIFISCKLSPKKALICWGLCFEFSSCSAMEVRSSAVSLWPFSYVCSRTFEKKESKLLLCSFVLTGGLGCELAELPEYLSWFMMLRIWSTSSLSAPISACFSALIVPWSLSPYVSTLPTLLRRGSSKLLEGSWFCS